MITDLDRTIKQLLTGELPIKNGEIEVKFDQPTREWSARLSRPTVDFFLYDVRENNVLRQHQWERVAQRANEMKMNRVSQKRTPFRLDCQYMVTTWAAESQDEHRLLSRTMLALLRHPILPQEQLVGAMQDQPFPVQARLASHDKLMNPAEIWSALDNELRPSVSYVLTVAMDPWTEVTGPAVRTLTMQAGQTETLPQLRRLVSGTTETMIFVGGVVMEDGAPVRGIQVAIRGTGFVATSDEEGRFTFGSIPPGDYTLVAWPVEGRPREKQISVPNGNYDIAL
jgi:hypothetical protein